MYFIVVLNINLSRIGKAYYSSINDVSVSAGYTVNVSVFSPSDLGIDTMDSSKIKNISARTNNGWVMAHATYSADDGNFHVHTYAGASRTCNIMLCVYYG